MVSYDFLASPLGIGTSLVCISPVVVSIGATVGFIGETTSPLGDAARICVCSVGFAMLISSLVVVSRLLDHSGGFQVDRLGTTLTIAILFCASFGLIPLVLAILYGSTGYSQHSSELLRLSSAAAQHGILPGGRGLWIDGSNDEQTIGVLASLPPAFDFGVQYMLSRIMGVHPPAGTRLQAASMQLLEGVLALVAKGAALGLLAVLARFATRGLLPQSTLGGLGGSAAFAATGPPAEEPGGEEESGKGARERAGAAPTTGSSNCKKDREASKEELLAGALSAGSSSNPLSLSSSSQDLRRRRVQHGGKRGRRGKQKSKGTGAGAGKIVAGNGTEAGVAQTESADGYAASRDDGYAASHGDDDAGAESNKPGQGDSGAQQQQQGGGDPCASDLSSSPKAPRESIGIAMRCARVALGFVVALLAAYCMHGPGFVWARGMAAHILGSIGGFGHRVHGIAATGSSTGMDSDSTDWADLPLAETGVASAGALGQVCCLGSEGGAVGAEVGADSADHWSSLCSLAGVNEPSSIEGVVRAPGGTSGASAVSTTSIHGLQGQCLALRGQSLLARWIAWRRNSQGPSVQPGGGGGGALAESGMPGNNSTANAAESWTVGMSRAAYPLRPVCGCAVQSVQSWLVTPIPTMESLEVSFTAGGKRASPGGGRARGDGQAIGRGEGPEGEEEELKSGEEEDQEDQDEDEDEDTLDEDETGQATQRRDHGRGRESVDQPKRAAASSNARPTRTRPLVTRPLPAVRPPVGAADWAAIAFLSVVGVLAPVRSLAVALLAEGTSGECSLGYRPVRVSEDGEEIEGQSGSAVHLGLSRRQLSREAAGAGEWPGAAASAALGWPALFQGSAWVAAFMTVALGQMAAWGTGGLAGAVVMYVVQSSLEGALAGLVRGIPLPEW